MPAPMRPMTTQPQMNLADAMRCEQVLAAVRDTSPIYYERYMIDKSNRPADVQQDAVDRITGTSACP
jgi:uncharacterized protein DUF5078